VHPTSTNANLNLHVTGPTVSVEPSHAKGRRGGYAGNPDRHEGEPACARPDPVADYGVPRCPRDEVPLHSTADVRAPERG
jgi:hypothetical protein